jgi:hypothetical protein
MPWQDRLLISFSLLLVLLAVVFVVYLLFGGLNTFALRPLRRCFEGLDLHETPAGGDVSFVYHTYRGLLFWFTQTEHRVFAPPEDAQRLLKRLLRFNLTWGLLSWGVLFIPFFAYGNYLAQRRSIEKQLAMQAE